MSTTSISGGPETVRDRYRGAMLGLAVGDALGTTVEFKAPGTFAPVAFFCGYPDFRGFGEYVKVRIDPLDYRC